MENIANKLLPNVPYICTSKGICTKSHKLMSDLIRDILKEKREDKGSKIPLVFLSGPSFAKEIIIGHIVGVCIASTSITAMETTQKILGSSSFR